jgi:ribonuclease HII
LDDGYDYETIIKGDEKIEEIALASIYAKVYRDRYMEELSKKYPEYGFEKHAGYGTSFHLKMITQHGLSELHRKSFLSKFK